MSECSRRGYLSHASIACLLLGVFGCAGQLPLPRALMLPPNETGEELWLRYRPVEAKARLAEYRDALKYVVNTGSSSTLRAAEAELVEGIAGLTGELVSSNAPAHAAGVVVLGTPSSSAQVKSLAQRLTPLGPEGYLVETRDLGGKSAIIVAGNSERGVLYGSFALLRHLQCQRTLRRLSLTSTPKIRHRLLNHWDNLDGSVERGYAGASIWDWNSLPSTQSKRYVDYARANASIGINGVVLNNVNADLRMLSAPYIDKVSAIASVLRPYGLRVYLSARFSAPQQTGELTTADPLDPDVKRWWVKRVDEIYAKIPDFGGFLVKANSEGQPGPGDYQRSHADGAKLLSDALAPHDGIVLWRAFVYAPTGVDRIRQAYDEFKPLDGQFGDHALVQIKNGPLDFQPREPFSPLFGALPNTPQALEFQVTKEYLGADTHLVYLGTLFEEVLNADTYAKGQGSTVARVIDGSLHRQTLTAIAGVANVGSDKNWTGSHFNQANWYAFGRMAWDPDAKASAIAIEWIRQTFSNDQQFVEPVSQLMLTSRQHLVDYMTPLGLVHLMGTSHHYGPAPWVDDLNRDDWEPFYFHRADRDGIGFDRTTTGSNAVAQYFSDMQAILGDRKRIPDDLLLFFHRVGWDEKLRSGRTLWEELVYRYSRGVDGVARMRKTWQAVEGRIDRARYTEVAEFLKIQHYEARWWRDACLLYFARQSGHAIPSGYAAPVQALSFYQALACPIDSTKPRCEAVYRGEPSPAILE